MCVFCTLCLSVCSVYVCFFLSVCCSVFCTLFLSLFALYMSVFCSLCLSLTPYVCVLLCMAVCSKCLVIYACLPLAPYVYLSVASCIRLSLLLRLLFHVPYSVSVYRSKCLSLRAPPPSSLESVPARESLLLCLSQSVTPSVRPPVNFLQQLYSLPSPRNVFHEK